MDQSVPAQHWVTSDDFGQRSWVVATDPDYPEAIEHAEAVSAWIVLSP
jgi:hypothetical protein